MTPQLYVVKYVMKKPDVACAIFLATIVLISLYSGYVINGIIVSNKPPVIQFKIGTTIRDITYGNSQTLDLYIPNATNGGSFPIVMYVHGGGMTSGDKEDLNPVFLDTLALAGYAVASINYRLAPRYNYPAQIQDVKCAIRYLRNSAQAYGLNGSEIFAFGTSVGGELVNIAALTGSNSQFDVGPYVNQSSSLKAVVDMFGPANLTETSSGWSSSGILQVFGNNRDGITEASPVNFIAANSPPILIVQGVNDTKVFQSQSIELYNDLHAAGDQTQLILVNNMGHMFAQVGPEPINPSLEQIAYEMVSFFNQYKQT